MQGSAPLYALWQLRGQRAGGTLCRGQPAAAVQWRCTQPPDVHRDQRRVAPGPPGHAKAVEDGQDKEVPREQRCAQLEGAEVVQAKSISKRWAAPHKLLYQVQHLPVAHPVHRLDLPRARKRPQRSLEEPLRKGLWRHISAVLTALTRRRKRSVSNISGSLLEHGGHVVEVLERSHDQACCEGVEGVNERRAFRGDVVDDNRAQLANRLCGDGHKPAVLEVRGVDVHHLVPHLGQHPPQDVDLLGRGELPEPVDHVVLRRGPVEHRLEDAVYVGLAAGKPLCNKLVRARPLQQAQRPVHTREGPPRGGRAVEGVHAGPAHLLQAVPRIIAGGAQHRYGA